MAPAAVPVQYGPRITTIVLYLHVGQFLSKKRTANACVARSSPRYGLLCAAAKMTVTRTGHYHLARTTTSSIHQTVLRLGEGQRSVEQQLPGQGELVELITGEGQAQAAAALMVREKPVPGLGHTLI